MQLLLAKSAYERVETSLAPLGRDLDIVTISDPDTFHSVRGVPIAAVDPDLAWISADALPKLLPTMMGRLLNGTNGKWAQLMFAGLDNPVFRTLMAKGVRLTKSSAQAIPIAEYVVGNAVSLILPIAQQAELQARQEWRITPYREIGHTRWTLIGFGSIGHEIARRIKPFGVHLTVVRRRDAGDGLADAVIGLDGLPDVLPATDVIVLACPLNEGTRHLADERFFQALKPGAILVNIGRGGLIDEAALRAGLERRQPAHAVLDVFETEPLPADHWAWRHPNVRVSGHTSAMGSGTRTRGDALFLDNLKRYLAGEPLINEASPAEVGL